ncbi:MAG: MotA/TolQ/ExbB proton channel family protein, partial [Zetaproteobacteria bacterium]|nr:MotA/TolQ/ExbB proton channel family protein [Zetaproteobacteria bacterium]
MSGIIGMAGIIYGLYFVFTAESSGFTGYYDLPSLVLLGILPPSIMLLSHKIGDFLTGIKILITSMFQNSRRQQNQVINALTVCSARVRAEGMGALVMERKKLPQGMLNDGVALIINNFSLEEIRHNLKAKMSAKQSQMALASNLFENMSKVSPGVGMIGTLLGLISMMSKLGDPAAIGSGMALALITTLYGLLLGTLIYAPLGEKIAIEAEKTYEIEQLVLEGVLALKAKKSSLHMKNIMNTFAHQSSPK